MTIDQRLEALTRNLELMALETEKHDRQISGRLGRVGERLDALTQSLQLLALETDKHDQQIKRALKL